MAIVAQKYSHGMYNLIKGMLNPDELARLSLDQIENHPLIRNHQKQSLKQLQALGSKITDSRISLKESQITTPANRMYMNKNNERMSIHNDNRFLGEKGNGIFHRREDSTHGSKPQSINTNFSKSCGK